MEGKARSWSKLVEASKIFFKIERMMSGSNGKIAPIDGLSKREQNKLERLMEAEKVTDYSNVGPKTFEILQTETTKRQAPGRPQPKKAD